MRKILKALSLVMVLVMCFTMVFTTAVSAEGTDTLVLSVDNAAPKAGDTVNITVTSNFTTVAGAHFAIDLAGLEYVSVAGDYAEYFSAETMNFVKEFNEDNGNLVESGVLFVITATVPADAEAGTVYNVGFGTIATNKEFCDYNENEVVVTKTGVDVTVAADEPSCDHANAEYNLVEITESNFEYAVDCPDCDEVIPNKFVEIGTPIDNVRFGYSIDPSNDFSIKCIIEDTLPNTYSNLIVVAEKQKYTPGAEEHTIDSSYLTEYVTDPAFAGCYVFKFSNIAAYELNNNINFTLWGMNADGEMVRLAYNTRSVVTYIDSQLAKQTKKTAYSTLLVDILNYGTYSQLQSNQNVKNLANSILTDTEASWGTPESEYPTDASECNALSATVTQTVNNNTSTPFGALGLGKAVYPSSKVNLRITLSKKIDDMSNVYCKFDYNASKTETKSYTMQYNNAVAGNYAIFDFDLSPLYMMDYPVTATVYYGDPDNGGIAVSTATYSIETYISARLSKDTGYTLKTLQAMFAYGNSMATYTGTAPYVAE